MCIRDRGCTARVSAPASPGPAAAVTADGDRRARRMKREETMLSRTMTKNGFDGRAVATCFAVFATAGGAYGCSGAAESTSVSGEPPPPSMTLTTPDLSLSPGEEKTYCYFTTLHSAGGQAVRRYSSRMTPGSHHLL